MRRWFGGIATTCRTATAYEESEDIAQPERAANGRQPFRSACIRASAAAASRG